MDALVCLPSTLHVEVTKVYARTTGCALVVREMLMFPDNHEIQGFGCNALAHLAYNMPSNTVAVTAAGGIEVVMLALRTHTDVHSIEAVCWGALVNLAEVEDARTYAVPRLGNVLLHN